MSITDRPAKPRLLRDLFFASLGAVAGFLLILAVTDGPWWLALIAVASAVTGWSLPPAYRTFRRSYWQTRATNALVRHDGAGYLRATNALRRMCGLAPHAPAADSPRSPNRR